LQFVLHQSSVTVALVALHVSASTGSKEQLKAASSKVQRFIDAKCKANKQNDQLRDGLTS
jgi:hypothetical protein